MSRPDTSDELGRPDQKRSTGEIGRKRAEHHGRAELSDPGVEYRYRHHAENHEHEREDCEADKELPLYGWSVLSRPRSSKDQ